MSNHPLPSPHTRTHIVQMHQGECRALLQWSDNELIVLVRVFSIWRPQGNTAQTTYTHLRWRQYVQPFDLSNTHLVLKRTISNSNNRYDYELAFAENWTRMYLTIIDIEDGMMSLENVVQIGRFPSETNGLRTSERCRISVPVIRRVSAPIH